MTRWLTCFVGLAAALALTASPAQAAYPSPPPDFAHPGTAHFTNWTPAGGARGRPMLVIYVAWSDVGFLPTLDAGQLSRRFFGPFPSIADYFRTQSFNILDLTPAAESDASGNGAADDGVVSVTLNQTKADFFAMSHPDQNKALLEAVDDVVDFSAFDTNGSGALDALELDLNRIESDNTVPFPQGCGITRGVAGVSLDGTQLGALSMAMDSVATNLITTAHENWHNLFGIRDLYHFGVGSFDVSGPTCGPGDTQLQFMAAWEKVHLGWIAAVVVTRDGYQDVREASPSSHDAFILYDFDRGTNDYFIVENRQRRPNTYESGASDSGLVIWRLDETKYASDDTNVRPLEIMRPDGSTPPGCTANGCYGGSSIDAWNAVDPNTPQRTMTRTWRDGADSRVAVRAVGCSGTTMRPYLDVRGPGVLVDTFALDNCNTAEADLPHLNAGVANPITYTVMNTGEASDGFDFTFEGLPAGWSANVDTKTLGAGIGATATVQVTPPTSAPAGQIFTLQAVGRSTSDGSVTSSAALRVKVNPKLSVSDAELTEGDSGSDDMQFVITLSESTDRSVTFSYATADGTAQQPGDYAQTSGGLNFAAGQQTKLVSVPIAGDTEPEPDETLFLNLSNAGGATIADGTGEGTILTDPEPTASIADASITEQDATLDFTVSLSEPNNTPVSVDFATADATATSPADYTATSGTLQIATGDTTATASVPIKEDFADELAETFTVTLSNIHNANIDPNGATATGTIVDDDRDGVFSCRATGAIAAGSEVATANAPGTPCRADSRSALRTRDGPLAGDALTSATAQRPAVLTGTSPQVGDRATAHTQTTNVSILSGLNAIVIRELTADARAECRGGPLPQLTGSSQVTLLSLGGQPVVTLTGHVSIPLILATLHVNETTTTRNGVVQRAIVLDNVLGADIVVGEAKAGFAGTDVHPDGSPCTA